ncbi:hypothetical protein D9M69_544790 [compost metagenome]
MQATPYPVPAKQHDPEETGLEEEGREHFIGQQRPGDAAGEVGETAPVGAELVGHDQPRDHAHAEVDGKDLRPEMVEIAVGVVVGLQPKPFEHRQEAGQPDGDGGKDNVERNRERELNARQVQCLQVKHVDILIAAEKRRHTAGPPSGRGPAANTSRKG